MPDTASRGFQLGTTLDSTDDLQALNGNISDANKDANGIEKGDDNDSSNNNNNNNNNNDRTVTTTATDPAIATATATAATGLSSTTQKSDDTITLDGLEENTHTPTDVHNDRENDVVSHGNLELNLGTSKTETTITTPPPPPLPKSPNTALGFTNHNDRSPITADINGRPSEHKQPSQTVNDISSTTPSAVEHNPASTTAADHEGLEAAARTQRPEQQLQSQLASQSDAIALLNDKLQQVENSACTTDEGLNQLLGNLSASTRNLAHNQQVLENKLEDLLRNQVHTDSSVNALLEKLQGVSQSIHRAARSNALASSSAGAPQSIHRGPGRPPKTRNGWFSVANSLSMTSKDSLPDSNVGIPRSRRMFQDPESSLDAESGLAGQARSLRQQQTSSSSAASEAAPKKRGPGRPPKRKHHWAERGQSGSSRAQSAEGATGDSDSEHGKDEEDVDEDDDDEYHASDEPKLEDDDYLARSLGDNSGLQVEDSFYEQKAQRGRGRPSSKSSDKAQPLTTAQMKMQQELERRRDAREQMLVSMKYSDRNKAKVFMESNKELLRAMREEERRKRMTAFHYDSQNQSGGNTPINTAGHSSPSPNAASGIGATRLSQFATLAAGNHGFDAENHDPSIVAQGASSHTEGGPGTPPSESTREATTTPTLASIAASSDYNTPMPPLPRKVGILSMLNEDEGEASGHKRRHPELYENGLSPDFPSKKERLEEGRDFRSIIPMLPEKKDNRGRPANSSSSGDNSTALLLASPVELLCRDGYFYRKSNPELPITTGDYLEFKFKSKEDELIRLNLSQSDYAELTRQDRINAYFLKPDIERETDFACRLLSKTVLTERYVNSLEYFTMEFRWENRLVGLGLKLRESKRTWQRRKALFALFEFWRDKSREKRGFPEYTMMHAVKEMENYRIFINRSVSWFYNHITLLKMILYDLCDNTQTQWREWMFPRGQPIPVVGESLAEDKLNAAIGQVLALDFLEDGTDNRDVKASSANVVVEQTPAVDEQKTE
ncbi:LAFA_0G06722g1_1 [Lachancea sp. 'fantastica']|nr:LAFA_0G06722g1_1 [Lachancea sp. 'fantastica']